MQGHRRTRGCRSKHRLTGRMLPVAVPLAGIVVLVAALLPAAGSARSQTAPKATGEPRILGTAIVGNTLTTTNGSWTGSQPLTFSYRWLRCPKDGGAPDGSNCGVIPDATKSAYQVRQADVGFRIRVRVTATKRMGRRVRRPMQPRSSERPHRSRRARLRRRFRVSPSSARRSKQIAEPGPATRSASATAGFAATRTGVAAPPSAVRPSGPTR